MAKLFIMGPGFQCMIETELDYDSYVTWLDSQLSTPSNVRFYAIDGDKRSTMIFKHDGAPCSIAVLNEKAHDEWRREQMFAAQQQLSQHGRRV